MWSAGIEIVCFSMKSGGRTKGTKRTEGTKGPGLMTIGALTREKVRSKGLRIDSQASLVSNRGRGSFICPMKIALLATILLSLPLVDSAEPANPTNPQAIERAMASDREAASRVKNDPARPQYHFLAPANWMNDPNGPIFYKGWWHMFYQHNPYGEGWGHMHWGHARSRDLVHWEHLPIALWASEEAGEEHVFSGCSLIDAKGEPMIIYTSIHKGKSATDFAEQWAAVPEDQDLIHWRKHPANPILAPEIHGATKVWDWRDPFYFKYKGGDYLVCGGNLNHGKGGQGVVNLYKAENKELTKWKYLDVLFTHPNPKVVNVECPNFFELDGKWVLIVSPHRKVDYFVGNFDGEKFTPEKQGLLDYSDSFYAPNCTTAPDGRRILWGWVRGFKGGQGWNGCLSLPRVLSIDKDGDLAQEPVKELQKLRTQSKSNADSGGSGYEAKITLPAPADGETLIVKLKGNSKELSLSYNGSELDFAGTRAPLKMGAGSPLHLHLFCDKSVIELYANNHAAITRVQYDLLDHPTIDASGARNAKIEKWSLQ
jgi:sucrose-6-phosphate hydrolase SacC (GH32 family)